MEPIINLGEGVYKPLDDSYLLAEQVEKLAHGRVLDLGTGTGLQGIVASLKGCEVVFADINPLAVRCAQGNSALNRAPGTFIVSDLFSSIRGKFDCIVFNPPYLPEDPQNTGADVALDGGADGRVFINRFLKEYRNYLKSGGFALLVESSLNNYEQDIAAFGGEVIARKKVFFEEIVVLKLQGPA
jgi:release factor glutamine methyltransferase